MTERFGLIFICFSEPKIEADEFFAELERRLDKYQLAQMKPIEARDFEFDVNWKISLENSLDFYHVTRVHPKTVGAHIDNLPLYENIDLHCLQTLHIAPYFWRTMIDKHCARRDVYTDHELSSLHKYYVFPNLVLNVLPYHLTIMQFFPIDHERCIMRYRFCMREKPSLLERTRSYASWVASRIILYEDVKIYPQIQRGMNQGSIVEQPLHKEEIGVSHFHASLESWLQDSSN